MGKIDFSKLLAGNDLFLITLALFASIVIAGLLRSIGKETAKSVSVLIKDKKEEK